MLLAFAASYLLNRHSIGLVSIFLSNSTQQIIRFPKMSDHFFLSGPSCRLFSSHPAEAILPSSGNSWGWCRAPRSWRTCRRAEWRQHSGYDSTPGPPPPPRIPHQRAELRRAAEGEGEEEGEYIMHSHPHAHTHRPKTQRPQTASVTCRWLAVSEGLTHPWSGSEIIPLDH